MVWIDAWKRKGRVITDLAFNLWSKLKKKKKLTQNVTSITGSRVKHGFVRHLAGDPVREFT